MANETYDQLSVQCPAHVRDALGDFFFDLGADGVQENDTGLLAYFSAERNVSARRAEIEQKLRDLETIFEIQFDPQLQIETFEIRDWNAEWRKTYQPIRISERILIKPSWHELPADAPPIIIEMDPEMAFGSGDHGTTATMLRLLEKNIQAGDHLLDVGTGTGILGIAAIKLGAASCLGFDNDPVAVETALKNAAANGVGNQFQAFTGTIEKVPPEPYRIVAANVTSGVIKSILPQLLKRLSPDARLLLSGILISEEDDMRTACQHHQLQVTDVLYQDEWLAFETVPKTKRIH